MQTERLAKDTVFFFIYFTESVFLKKKLNLLDLITFPNLFIKHIILKKKTMSVPTNMPLYFTMFHFILGINLLQNDITCQYHRYCKHQSLCLLHSTSTM